MQCIREQHSGGAIALYDALPEWKQQCPSGLSLNPYSLW